MRSRADRGGPPLQVSPAQFNLTAHNASDYDVSVGPATTAFELCAVLYPGDGTREGKALRIKQQYFLCSASLQDIMARYVERSTGAVNWGAFASKARWAPGGNPLWRDPFSGKLSFFRFD